jgi:hypothetical protein
MRAIHHVGGMERGREILWRRRDDQSLILPVIQILGFIGTNAPSPNGARAAEGELLVLAKPVVAPLLLIIKNAETMSLNRLARLSSHTSPG